MDENVKYRLESIDKFQVQGKEAFAIDNPETTDDFSNLVDNFVYIDGEKRKVVSVERFLHSPPWHKGERISIVCE